jgi:hypothetical protein
MLGANMSILTLKRIIVWVIAMALGALTTVVILAVFLPAVNPSPNPEAVVFSLEGTSVGKYGPQYFFWTAFPLGLVYVVILDYFVGSRILPD